MMEELNELFNITGGIVTTILLPLFGVFMFYDSARSARRLRKRERRKLTISPRMLLNGRNCYEKEGTQW